jgi:hypothetical protein
LEDIRISLLIRLQSTMDEWSKKKLAASHGGRGMVKYIDYEEQKRLSRLRNVRGSINQSMQHNSWQASQLEKRRKEQIRQRKKKMDAQKRAAEKKVFQVDTGCAATPYEFTKCGLKLRLEKSSSTASAPVKNREVKREADKPATKPLMSQYAKDSIELNRRKHALAQKNNLSKRKEEIKANKQSSGTSVKKEDTDTKKNVVTTQNKDSTNKSVNLVRDNSGSSNNSNSSSGSEGKENGGNQNQEQEKIAKQTLAEGKLLLQRKKTKKKSTDAYFMDFESLKREHAHAIEMLKQLDEENKRLFARRNGEGGEIRRTVEEEEDGIDEVDESLAVTLPEGMLHATHLSISLHDIEDNDLQDDLEVGFEPEAESDNDSHESESEYSCSNSSWSKQEVEEEEEEEEEQDTDVEFA